MAVRQDLPHAFHRMEGRDFRGRKDVALLDPTVANRAHGGRSETDRAGRHGAPVDVGLPADVHDLGHPFRMGARAISPSRLCQAFPVGRAPYRGPTTRARRICQVDLSDATSIIYDARGSRRLRADWLRAGRDGKGDRSAVRPRTILLRATNRHATQRMVGDANTWQG